MESPHEKLQQLQQEWSSEMETFRQLRKTHDTLTGELRECLQKLDALALRRSSGTTPPASFRN